MNNKTKTISLLICVVMLLGILVGGNSLLASTSPKEDIVVNKPESTSQKEVSKATKVDTKEEIKEETKEEVESSDSVDSEWSQKLMANVEDNLSVRAEASTEAELVGRLRKGDVADIIETLDGWYKITSGNVEGYVSAEYCVTGDDAKTLSEEVCKKYAIANTDGLRVRKDDNIESSVVTMVTTDTKMDLTKEECDAEWVSVSIKGAPGFVKKEFVNIETVYGKGITIEEEWAAIKAKQEAEKKAQLKAKANQTGSPGRSQNASLAASVDELTLLGALIQCETGYSNYEGMLAVGAVVVNRARRGYGGGSIRGVIMQPGQFPPATNGKVDSVLASGVNGACIQAASEALAGVDNTGGAVNFRSAKSGVSGVVIGGNVYF